MSAGELKVWAPEVSARFSRALLYAVEATHGSAVVDEIVGSLGLGTNELYDETAWLSLEFCETLLDRAVEHHGDIEILRAAGRAAFSPRVLGFLYPFIRAFATPELTYRKIVDSVGLVNKVGRMRTIVLEPGHFSLEYKAVEGAPVERTRHMCILRGAQLAAVPGVFGLPHARLIEHECQALGGARCLYEFHWLVHRRSVGLMVGLAGGVAATFATTALMSLAAGAWLPLGALLTVCGGSIGALVDARREIKRRGRYLEEQNNALVESARATEDRFVEVVEAKREVDDRVEARTAELNDALDRLRELDRVKNDFFANVSHELRTPLTLILGPLEAMLAEPARVDRADLMTVHRNATRLLHLINQILDLAKADAGGLRIRPTPSDLRELVAEIARPFSLLARQRHVELTLEDGEPVTEVPVDRDKLDVALSNLLANALKFTPEGGAVTVRVERDGDDAVIEVADTGPGVSESDHDRVFERFAQATQGGQRVAGTGIGLALVREIAVLHGGSVSLLDGGGKVGARFALRLPTSAERIPSSSLDRRREDVPTTAGRRRADRDPVGWLAKPVGPLDEIAAARGQDGESRIPDELPAGTPTILVVEDHAELREFISRALRRRFRVIGAADGAQGWAMLREHMPELVVSDVMMPGIDGHELCRRIKSQVATRPIPVILLTARSGVERVVEGFAAGADDYLTKPFNERELLARVEVHLRVRHLVREIVQREKLALLGTVAAGVAHEVRNPLSVVQGVLPRVGKVLGELDADTREVVELMKDSVARISSVAQDLLNLSALDRERTRPWDPREGIEATLRLLRVGSGAGVEVVFEPGGAAEIEARPGELNQVLLNVMDNAMRAAGDEGRVKVETAVADERYRIAVSDSGPGIPSEVMPRIFDAFFTTREAGEGTGLGLAIAQKIVAEHLGSMHVDCPEQGGTRVEIELPLAQVRARESVQ